MKSGMGLFLPPGLPCRWAWHTGLQSPDSQISSPLAQWSWAANPLPPVSELQCSANDRGLKKVIKFDSTDETSCDFIAVAAFCDSSHRLNWPYSFPQILTEARHAFVFTSNSVQVDKKGKASVVSRSNSFNFCWFISAGAYPQAWYRAFYDLAITLMSISGCSFSGGHCWTAHNKTLRVCVLWQPNKQICVWNTFGFWTGWGNLSDYRKWERLFV